MGFTLGTKFNEGTDWEFTVSQETIADAVQAEGGITEADIADYCYCAFIDQRISAMVPESGRQVNDGLYPWATEYCPVYNTNQGAHPSELKMNVGVLDANKVVCYERNLLTCYADIGGVTGHYLVMDIKDIKKWMVNCDSSGAFGSIAVTSTAGFNGINDTIYYYDTNNVPVIEPVAAPPGTQGNLYPLNVVNIADELWIGFFTPMSHSKDLLTNEHLTHQAWDYAYSAGDIYNSGATGYIYQAGTVNYQGWCNFSDLEFPTSTGTTTGFNTYIDADGFSVINITGQYGNNSNPFITNCMMGNMFKTLRALHTVQSWAGFLFYANNTLYKPIIEGGIVTGFTSDMDIPSEWDDMTNVTGNNISPTPPTPPTPSSGDDMEAMATGATGSSGGFTHFYVMSSQDLIDFLADFYTRASSGETLTNNLVCSYILGIPSSEFCATEEVEIAIHNSAQGTPFVSQAKYSHITATNNLLVIGSFNVPRITNTFYDFAPYSTYEVFIPCCGWVALPDTVAGRTINVEMYIDIASCCLKAAVKTNDLGVCAVTNGVLGAAIPIAVIESGILRGNNIQAGLGIIGGGINTGVGAGSGSAMGIGFGVQQILNGLVECTIAGNTNYTQQKGGTGDITQFAMGHKCYMKVTHPDIDPVVNNSIFGHSVGYLCNSIGNLSEYKGFTVCGNPHVTFSASAEEREEIERLLSMGVIL